MVQQEHVPIHLKCYELNLKLINNASIGDCDNKFNILILEL